MGKSLNANSDFGKKQKVINIEIVNITVTPTIIFRNESWTR